MAEFWQTIEQAAVSLRLSVRTVNRHIVAGKLQSRLNDGRREVLVEPPAATGAPGATQASASPFADGLAAGAASAIPTDFADTTSVAAALAPHAFGQPQQSSSALTLDQETVLALADNAAEKAEMAVTAYQALARVADVQAQQVRRTARAAWAAVAVMAVGVTCAVGWATHRVTRLSVERDDLIEEVAERARTADKLSAERETLRAELLSKQESFRAEAAAAREQAAHTEGKLATFIEQEQARQTREAVMAAAAPTEPANTIFSHLSLNPTSAAPVAALPGPRAAGAAGEVDQPLSDQRSAPSGHASDSSRTSDTSEQDSGSDTEAHLADVQADSSDARVAKVDTGPSEAEGAAGNSALVSAPPTVELDKSDAPVDTLVAKSANRPRGGARQSAHPEARRAKAPPVATRPVAPRRKARVPAPRPGASSDTTSASTTDDR